MSAAIDDLDESLDAARQQLAEAERMRVAECSEAIADALKAFGFVLLPEITIGPQGVVQATVKLVPRP